MFQYDTQTQNKNLNLLKRLLTLATPEGKSLYEMANADSPMKHEWFMMASPKRVFESKEFENYMKKADELDATITSNFGSEFTQSNILLSQIFERAKDEDSILRYLPQRNVIQLFNTAKISLPVEGGKIVMNIVPESDDYPATPGNFKRFGTAKVGLECKTFLANIGVTNELMEDSVVMLVDYISNLLVASFDTTVHEVLLNGDVNTTNTNINTEGAVASATDARTGFDGARKNAITEGKTVDTGVLDLADVRTGRALLGAKGTNPKNLLMIVSTDVYFKLLGLSQVETLEKFGGNATVVNGRLTAIDGVPLITRQELQNAQATGKVSSTAGNNTKGQAVLIHTPSWAVAIRRGLKIEPTYDASRQTTITTGSSRFAIGFSNGVDGQYASALMRNITL